MNKKMYSFRLNKNLIDNAKKIAKKMDISLSLFISCLIKEKINSLNSKTGDSDLIKFGETVPQILREIVMEIKGLRSDLNKSFKKIRGGI